MKKVELLSPAGDFESLKAAVNNGADAVYLGGKSFSARAFAKNFNDEEIKEAVKYCHLRNVKVYVTINTLFNEYELENAYKQAKYYYEIGVDALLIQDLGLFYRLRYEFNDFELHASTQMHVHNISGVKTLKELGFNRVVLARESSLDLIKEATKQGIEIETFVHGAICVSYSGQCLMSSVCKNRSANKGQCAQMCRLKYSLYENENKVKTSTDYLLSPKDMCLINDVPKLIEAGVSSLKIEGRMKSSAYVGYVTSLYRKAIDAYYDNKEFKLSEKELNNLKTLYNRDFTNSYLLNDGKDIFNNVRPNHMGIKIGEVVSIKGNKVKVKLFRDVNQFDGIRIISKNDTGLILNMIKVNDLLVSSAKANEIIEFILEDKVNISDEVVKTLDYKLEEKINNYKQKLIDIHLNIQAIPNDYINILCNINGLEFKYSGSDKLEKAIKHSLTEEDFVNTFNSKDDHPYNVVFDNIYIDNAYLYLKNLNELRRDFYNKLDEFILSSYSRKEYPVYKLEDLKEINQEKFIKLSILDDKIPVINKDSVYNNNYNLVKEVGGLLLNTLKDAYYTLNVSNSYSFEYLLRLGFSKVILSTELNDDEIKYLEDGFKKRTNLSIKPYIIKNINRTLMYLNRNPFKDYINDYSNVKLSDGFNVFKVINKNNIIEIQEYDSLEVEPSINLADY